MKIELAALDSTYSCKVHPNGCGALKKVENRRSKINRKNRWEYDKELYKQRNIVERAFRRLKEFRRVFTRYEKLDDIFIGFVYFGLTIIMIK